jgi:hypothetical protein
MPSLTIPENYRAALKDIWQLSDDATRQLTSALSTAPLSPSPKEIAKAVSGIVSEIPANRLTDIVDAILALYLVRAQAEVSPDRFIKDLIASLPEVPPDGLDPLKKRLKALLTVENLSTITKAVNLRSEYAETYCTAKVLTDLRPVWRSDPEVPPIGAIVTHTLKLEYHHGTVAVHRELYVGMDSNDIEELITALKRAKQKEKSLKELMKKVDISDLKG